jgi:hypothetical protein
MEEPPAALVERLRMLRPTIPFLEQSTNQDRAAPVSSADRQKIGWGSAEAKEAYFKFSAEMDQWEEKDRRKFELGMRVTENAVRCATIVATGCGALAVGRKDIEWAVEWSRVSFGAADGGFKKYMRDYFEFPKFCEQVQEKILNAGRFMSTRDLRRHFRSHMKFGNELEKALQQLQQEGRIKYSAQRSGSRGPEAHGYELVDD